MDLFGWLKTKLSKSRLMTLVSTENAETTTWQMEDPKYAAFQVEHYPLTGFYYAAIPRNLERGIHSTKYLKKDYFTGWVSAEGRPAYATCCETLRGAWNIVDLYIEQQTRSRVVIHRR